MTDGFMSAQANSNLLHAVARHDGVDRSDPPMLKDLYNHWQENVHGEFTTWQGCIMAVGNAQQASCEQLRREALWQQQACGAKRSRLLLPDGHLLESVRGKLF